MNLIEDLKDYLGFAVAGNFANHLGEAGEADEFSVIETKEKDAPKGMFPFYIKGHDSFLGTYPICDEVILTHGREDDKLQVEAEVALNGKVLATGKGKSKKEAEMQAAKKALENKN